MGSSFTITSFFLLLFAILTGVAIAWLLYSKSDALSRKLKLTLAGIRAISIAIILWLLFSPLIRQVSYTLEKPIILIAQDNSQSIAAFTAAGFNPAKYQRELHQLVHELSEQYEVRTYSFSDKLRNGLDFGFKGKLSNIGLLESQLTDEFANRNVGAVIVATDGIFNREGNGAALAKLNAPVYTIALGDTIPKKDILISNINHNDLVYLDNEFNLEVRVDAYESKNEQSTLRVTENGKLINQQNVMFKDQLFSKQISLPLKASSLGQHRYTVSLSPLRAEVSTINNSRQVTVEVIDGRQKVLIAADGPHPDISALHRAISSNKHHEVSLALGNELLTIKPEKYALIILYQLPAKQGLASSFITQVQSSKVPVLYVIGMQSNLGLFNTMQEAVKLTADNGAQQYSYSAPEESFSAFDLDAASRKVISNFDPLQMPSAQLKTGTDARVVLRQRRGKNSSNEPQLFFITANNRKMGYLIGEGLWKWQLSEARDGNGTHPVFNELISKIVQYLSLKDDKRKFRVYPAQPAFDENEQVILNATLYNDSYESVNAAEVNIKISNERGQSYPYTFSQFESAYQLDAGLMPPGRYEYLASTKLGSQQYQAKGYFYVNKMDAEFQQTIANHRLLYQLSAQTAGKMVFPPQLLTIKNELKQSDRLKTLSYEDRKFEALINKKWLFFAILLLLATEWFFRKRNSAL